MTSASAARPHMNTRNQEGLGVPAEAPAALLFRLFALGGPAEPAPPVSPPGLSVLFAGTLEAS